MSQAASESRLRIVGRSSSHFTRVVRIFAEECEVPCELQLVPSLLASDADVYGGHPGLRVPTLLTAEGPVFGSLPSCRALASLATRAVDMVWPEHTRAPLAVNALELAVQAMSTEVTWIMTTTARGESSPYALKSQAALKGMLSWLDAHVDEALNSLPTRDLSYLELSLFCLVDHLEFRKVTTIEEYPHLVRCRDAFAERPSARATPFRFDV
jgi:glutathione S-transferase